MNAGDSLPSRVWRRLASLSAAHFAAHVGRQIHFFEPDGLARQLSRYMNEGFVPGYGERLGIFTEASGLDRGGALGIVANLRNCAAEKRTHLLEPNLNHAPPQISI